ncbi:MAG: hypothetical protein AB7U26_00065 [Sulfuricurvum sp.]
MLSKNVAYSPLLFIIAMSFLGCTKEPLVSIPAYPQQANEGIIYYLPKNVYRLDVDARLTQCGTYRNDKVVNAPEINTTIKIGISTIADENAAYTARPQEFGDWNDDFTTHFTRSPNGMFLSVDTSNDDKSAEVASGYIAAAASVALAVQTGGISLAFPSRKKITYIDDERPFKKMRKFEMKMEEQFICKEEHLSALTKYEEYKRNYDQNTKEIAQLSEEIANIEKNIANAKEAGEKGEKLLKLLNERDKNDKKLAKLNKEIASSHEEMVKLDKQLTFTTSMNLFDSSEQQDYQQTIELGKMIKYMFNKEFLEKRFDNNQIGAEILHENLSIIASMTDANGNTLKSNYVKPMSLEKGWRYNNTEPSGFRGIVYRDRKNAYLEIVNLQNGRENMLYKDWVPFLQGGMIGVAPLYNWDGKGSSSVKFDENGSLVEYKAEITESAGEKSANAAKAVGETAQGYSDKSIALETKQAQHEIEMLQLKQQIRELKDKLNVTP